MPCTFSHPLAAALLHRVAPARLSLAALVIGSMTPDFGYYTGMFPVARYAHTIPGTFLVCLPAGFLALIVFYFLRSPFCFLLPQPHRRTLLPMADTRPQLTAATLLSMAASLLLGAWSHTLWDSFTHDGAWTVERLPLLQTTVIQFGNASLSVAYLLQQTSTLVGGAALAFLYFRWLGRKRAEFVGDGSSDRCRYVLLVSLIAVSFAIAIPFAAGKAGLYDGYTAVRVMLFRTAIYASAAFLVLVVISCVSVIRLARVPQSSGG